MLHTRRRVPDYPRAPLDASAKDDYFGTTVYDPYRPLEQLDAPETKSWVEAENRLTQDYLGSVDGRGAIDAYLKKI